MGFGSPIHWFLIAVVLVLLFGNRLPSVMRSLGQGITEFKKGVQGIEDDVKNSVNKSEERPHKTQSIKEEKIIDTGPLQG